MVSSEVASVNSVITICPRGVRTMVSGDNARWIILALLWRYRRASTFGFDLMWVQNHHKGEIDQTAHHLTREQCYPGFFQWTSSGNKGRECRTRIPILFVIKIVQSNEYRDQLICLHSPAQHRIPLRMSVSPSTTSTHLAGTAT